MTVDKSVLTSLLKLSHTGPVRKELLAKDARVPIRTIDQTLRKLSQGSLLKEKKNTIEVSPNQRLIMAIYALKLGADFERVGSLLSWTEFESIAAKAFEANGYRVLRNFHFKHATKKREIDIVGLKKPLIVCVDCKQWKRGWRKAATVKAVEVQTERTEAFAKALPNYYQKARLEGWETAILIPTVLSLASGPYKFYNNVPIVPILQLQDFINGLPVHIHILKTFHQKRIKLNENLQRSS